MTLFQFLNQVRKNGGDITRLKISKIDGSTSIWREGLKINGLRGNRLSVEYNGDHELMTGHSILKCLVETVSRLPPSKTKLSQRKSAQPAILIVVKDA